MASRRGLWLLFVFMAGAHVTSAERVNIQDKKEAKVASEDDDFNPEKEGVKFRAKLLLEGKTLQAELEPGRLHPFLQTRIDRAVLGVDKKDPTKKTLVVQFEGVFFFLAEKDKETIVLFPDGKDKESNQSSLIKWLEKECQKINIPGKKLIRPDVTKIRFIRDPAEQLQKRAVADGLDGSLFRRASFDADGNVSIHAFFGDGVQKAKLSQLIKEEMADPAPGILVKGATYKETLDEFRSAENKKPVAWHDFVRKLQVAFSEDKNEIEKEGVLFSQTRLDRAYFDYVEGLPKVFVEGIHLHHYKDPPKDLMKQVNGRLKDACNGLLEWPRDPPAVASKLEVVRSPVFALQKLTTANERLDGCLWSRAKYGEDGTLYFIGLVGHPDNKKELESILIEKFGKSIELGPAGKKPRYSLDKMEMIKRQDSGKELSWKEVVGHLQREFAEDEQADSPFPAIRLDRMYFDCVDAEHKLYVEGVHICRDKAHTDLAQVVRDKLHDLWSASFQRAKDHRIETKAVKSFENPVEGLQRAVVEKRLDGVLFENARYDGSGRLRFDGLRGSSDQDKGILQLINARLKDSQLMSSSGIAPLDSMRAIEWPSMIKRAQDAFAHNKEEVLTKTRIDRAYFEQDATSRKVRIVLEAVCIHSADDLDNKRRLKCIDEGFRDILKKVRLSYELDTIGVEFFDDPIYELQNIIDKNEKMEGVVLLQSHYDSKGTLIIRPRFAYRNKQEPLFNEIKNKLLKDKKIHQAPTP